MSVQNTHAARDFREDETACNMTSFFKAYSQFIVLGVTVSIMVVILAFSVPPYLVWTANKSVAREEAKGLAVFAKAAQEAQIVVEQAQAHAQAMGVIARGERSAANTRADTIEIVGNALKGYPNYTESRFYMPIEGDYE